MMIDNEWGESTNPKIFFRDTRQDQSALQSQQPEGRERRRIRMLLILDKNLIKSIYKGEKATKVNQNRLLLIIFHW